jgi:hypothetical protein
MTTTTEANITAVLAGDLRASLYVIECVLIGRPETQPPAPAELFDLEAEALSPAADVADTSTAIADWFDAHDIPGAGDTADMLRRFAAAMLAPSPNPAALAADVDYLGALIRRGYDFYEDEEN